jgi:putative ABC transport system permease protein
MMSWHRSLGERLRALFDREREETDMDEQIRFHVDMETEKHVGQRVAPAEARRRALVACGGVDRYSEQTRNERGTRGFEDLFRDVRFAFRQVRRNPGFSLVSAFTVGLGVGATVLGFVIADTVVLGPLPYPDADRLVRIQETNPEGDPYSMSAANFLDLAASSHSFSELVAFNMRQMALLGDAEPYQVRGMAVTPGYFKTLGASLALGRAFEPADAPVAAEGPVVVLSHGIWERLFASDPGILGTSVDLGGTSRTVVGVAPAGFKPLESEEVWVPFGPDPSFPRGDHRLEAIGRLAPGTTLDAARAELRTVAARLGQTFPLTNGGWGFRVRSFPQWLIADDAVRAVSILSGAGLLLLLLSCASVSTLLLSRLSARQREVALRSALGAGTFRIARQLLVESLVMAAGGALVGVLLAAALVPVIQRLGPAALPRLDQLSLQWRAIAVAVLTTAGAGVLFGLAPAIHAVGGGFSQALQASSRTVSSGGSSLRNALVGGQMALAVVLLVGAGLLASTFLRLGRVDPGFRAEGVLAVTISLQPDRYPMGQRPVGLFYRDVLERIRAIPGVTAAGAYNVSPFHGPRPSNQVAPTERSTTLDDFMEIQWRAVTPGFFEAMSIPLVRGRYLEKRDDSWDAFMAVLNQGGQPPMPVVITTLLAQHLWPDVDPVGRHLVWNRPQGGDLLVVGVVEPIRDVHLAAEPAPMVFLPDGLVGMTQMTLLVKSRMGAAALADPVRRAIWSVDRDTPVPDVRPLEAAVDGERAGARLNLWLVGTLALCALLLATLSLYGVVSFTTSQRTREIGIRVALGASGREVVGTIVRRALGVVLVGAAAGVGGALLLSRVLRSVLFGVEATDAYTYVTVVVTLGLAALLASYLPARRAARVEPGKALAAE